MEYIIAIPSYQRATILKDRTLDLLKRYNIPLSQIEIHVESKKMKKEYRKIIGRNYNITVSNAKGICATRNYLRHYYKYETNYDKVVFIDDDIEKIIDYDQPIQDLNSFIKDAFVITKSNNLTYWGISPFHNTFYLKKEVTTNLKYLPGCFTGLDLVSERTKDDVYCDVGHGEDSQFSMEYFLRDNGVLRINYVYCITKYFEEGGICASLGGLENRKKEMEINSKYLVERYGDMCKLINKDYGYDVRLNFRYINN